MLGKRPPVFDLHVHWCWINLRVDFTDSVELADLLGKIIISFLNAGLGAELRLVLVAAIILVHCVVPVNDHGIVLVA